MELVRHLEAAGARVIGPAPTVPRAVQILRSEAALDGAVLDVNVNGTSIDEVARLLRDRGVPVLFQTGYGAEGLPSGFDEAPVLTKPTDPEDLIRRLALLTGAAPARNPA